MNIILKMLFINKNEAVSTKNCLILFTTHSFLHQTVALIRQVVH